MKKKWIFAVHKYETGSGKHDVSYGAGNRYKTKTFSKWSKAEDFAREKAKEMNVKQYKIDTPSRPHKMVNVNKQSTKPKKRKPQRRSLFQIGGW